MNERKSSKWRWTSQVHVNLRMRREALRDDTPGTKIQETMVLILIYPEACCHILASHTCWQLAGKVETLAPLTRLDPARTGRNCALSSPIFFHIEQCYCYFDEGLPNGQSRVIIEPSDPQNDGEIAEEANQEDDERLIYPSTLEDESDGKSDAEASKMVYTPRRQLRMQRILCTFLPHHLLLPLNFVIHSTRPHRAPFQDNDNQTEMFRHYISTSGELHRVIVRSHVHGLRGAFFARNQWWSELEIVLYLC
ncbi:hypothetical protein BJ912DRAFT_1043150 [Pholiota molesta]|nr:hypothetical protein BJ912DRAFT_1043150 [Pholiota molesta]